MNNLTIRKIKSHISVLSVLLVFSAPTSVIAGGVGTHEHHEHRTANESGQAGGHGHHQHDLEWGEPGSASGVNRTIEVVMGDIYFKPESVQASEGDTIRFILKNVGSLIHEFNIGTIHMHREHQREMAAMLNQGVMSATSINHEKMQHNDMKHDDPNSVLLEPGQTAELVWRFNQAKDLEFACNVPGHYEAGMVGSISVEKTMSKVLQ